MTYFLPQLSDRFLTIQLLKLSLCFSPERLGSQVQTPSVVCQLNEAASTVGGRRFDCDKAVLFQEANHFPHRCPFDIEPFSKDVDVGTSYLIQGRQSEELRDTQAYGLEMFVVKTRDLTAR